ncbi:MAG: tRNA preQ1(34) S-adenosylmethionine ribosyltransferase-isomerase QueA, partial [Gammaproteobacteria bacterium]|nr:tRNA preQ1(34) S-adenosylmethionine ribosyltransferase-isomerase QueA [Gammaproteobacteria bacterium]
MLLTDFDFELPDELIARYPPAERRDSRLLELGDTIVDRHFSELPGLLQAGDLLVLNDTRVIPARVHGRKTTGAAVELLVERLETSRSAWAHVRTSKPLRPDARILLQGGESATVRERSGELVRLDFSCDLRDYLGDFGEVPLPPYLRRPAVPEDTERYQTVYAKREGAVAAPTAGLHFDEAMLAELSRVGVAQCYVTLHVGAGTFQSLRELRVEDNRLHAERVDVSQAVCDAVIETRAAGGRVVAVGTTSVRALEAASRAGEMLPLEDSTDLFIYPGYEFRSTDLILT